MKKNIPGPRVSWDSLRPLVTHCWTAMGAEPSDLHFVNCEQAGAMDAGAVAEEDPSSGLSIARAAIPDLAKLIRL